MSTSGLAGVCPTIEEHFNVLVVTLVAHLTSCTVDIHKAMALIFGALCSSCICHDAVHKFLSQLDILNLNLLREAVRLAEVLDSGRLLNSALLHVW